MQLFSQRIDDFIFPRKRKLRNYLSWRVANTHFAKLKKLLNSKEEVNYSWKDCVVDTIDQMDFAVSSMFLRKRVDSESKKHLAQSMTASIKEAFKENLNNLDWLNDETRVQVREKVDAMDSLIGKSFLSSYSMLFFCSLLYA